MWVTSAIRWWPVIVILATSCGAATPSSDVEAQPGPVADVVAVAVSGTSGAYTFSVGIESPDTGCVQYADWWEVVDESGALLHRRLLTHSHVDEQPFVRSGGPVAIAADRVVWVRAHMVPGGFGGAAWRGSVVDGFEAAELAADFASETAELEPLPTGCRF